MLELKKINKQFGDKNAVRDLSFKVHEGEIVGLIGQNGAGKSTTFRMILDFIQPDSGEILWNGHTITREEKLQIGFMPEERGLFQKETIESQIKYFAELHGMGHKQAKAELIDWMHRLNVVGSVTSRVESLSKGNAQKIQLIATMMFHPKLLILDEPFSGLDPVNAELLVNEVKRLRDVGTMIIFSDHNMSNVEELSDYIVMLKNGATVLSGTPIDISQQFGRLELSIDGYDDVNSLTRYNSVRSMYTDNHGITHLQLANEEVGHLIYTEITKQGYVATFDQHYPSLDEIFRRKVSETIQMT